LFVKCHLKLHIDIDVDIDIDTVNAVGRSFSCWLLTS